MKSFLKMNLPNKLTTLRMLAVIILIILALIPWEGIKSIPGNNFLQNWMATNNATKFDITWLRYTMLGIFVLASITDYLDGYIARKNNIVTTYGKFMDPIADKLLVNTTLILLAVWFRIPVGCVILMIGRDIFVDVLRMLMVERGKVIAANKWGKAKTVMQMTAIIAVFLFPIIEDVCVVPIDIFLCYIATIISVISGIKYFTMNRKDLFILVHKNGSN